MYYTIIRLKHAVWFTQYHNRKTLNSIYTVELDDKNLGIKVV